MPITIGIGTASIARRTQPDRPRTSMRTPVARNAPTTSGKARCASAGPTSTVPGIVQKNTRGWRYRQEKAMLMSPFTKNEPKIQDERSDAVSPPCVPTARTIATGPDAAKMNPTSALTP